MSHIVTVHTQIRDAEAVSVACRRLSWQQPVCGKHQLFTSQVEGLAVHPPRWRFPIVCELDTGSLRYDNYGGVWGDERDVDRFKQAYAVEKASIEARKLGRSVYEQTLADGTVKLSISAGATA
ncbi:MAG: DUF1257 domain-containing protein [Pirellulales bacterium]